MKHTPGPWMWRQETPESGGEVYAVNGINRYICTTSGNVSGNTPLIADAPRLKDENERLEALNADMLAALKAINACGWMTRSANGHKSVRVARSRHHQSRSRSKGARMKLTIENLLIHEHLEIDLQPGVNVVTGTNSAGKSSVALTLSALAARHANPAQLGPNEYRDYIRDGSKRRASHPGHAQGCLDVEPTEQERRE